ESFRHHAFEFKIPSRLDLPSLTGVKPLPFIAGRTRQSLRRLLVSIHPRLRDQPGMRSVEAAENLAAISDKEKALVLLFFRNLERAIWLQFVGARGLQATVVPRELDRR